MIEFIQQHWDDALSIIGAAYALALGIVKLTPTPRDDAYVGRIAAMAKPVYKVLVAVFGLNPDQGVGSKVVGPTYPKPRSRPKA